MPIYEYRCTACQQISEALVRGGNEPTSCPACGESALTRLISRAGIIFKGSGFYVNDSKSGGGSSSASSTSTSKSDDSAKTTSTSESKKEGGDKTTPSSTSSAD